MNTYVFRMECLSNLHAGSGDSGGFGVVDKLVQRDPANNGPVIHASGLKGALREHFSGQSWVERVFGSDSSQRGDAQIKPGEYKFFQADLLALPQPQDAPPYFRQISSVDYLEQLRQHYVALGAGQLTLAILQSTYQDNPNGFRELADNLPVIARNQLDNGISKNLWYEEVVPRQSVFLTCIKAPDRDLIDALNGQVVQVGGNATVGYGFCKFTLI